MIHVVLVYRREAGELMVQESFADGDVAMRRRFEPERVPEYADTEIVVLSADSVDTLRETRGRTSSPLRSWLGGSGTRCPRPESAGIWRMFT